MPNIELNKCRSSYFYHRICEAPAPSKHAGGCVASFPFNRVEKVAAKVGLVLSVLTKVDKCQINELHWKYLDLLIPLWFLLSSTFLSLPSLFFLPLFHLFFFFLPCLEHLNYKGVVFDFPLEHVLGFTQCRYHIPVSGFLPSLRIKQRPGAISFILNDHAFIPQNPSTHWALFSCYPVQELKKINHQAHLYMVSGRKHLGADKIQFN